MMPLCPQPPPLHVLTQRCLPRPKASLRWHWGDSSARMPHPATRLSLLEVRDPGFRLRVPQGWSLGHCAGNVKSGLGSSSLGGNKGVPFLQGGFGFADQLASHHFIG